jgi:hypothetical protein
MARPVHGCATTLKANPTGIAPQAIIFLTNNCFEARVEKLVGFSVPTHQFKYGSAVALEFALPEAADVFEVF